MGVEKGSFCEILINGPCRSLTILVYIYIVEYTHMPILRIQVATSIKV